ncbi:MAG: hypothetical protein D6801_09580 [Alphaproteobacteria bacterium]|nr:MAG: hypothetical protein D6801_09580 [Alphaproteobacteria bacterium]
MSEAVSKAEIEDVLESIRRLVSADSGALRRDDAAQETEKLVLTPAFRVDPEHEAAPKPRDSSGEGSGPDEAAADSGEEATRTQAEAHEAGADVPPAEAAPSPQAEARSLLERRIAELEAAVTLSGVEYEPDGSEAAASEDAGEAPFVHVEETAAEGEANVEAEGQGEDAAEGAPEAAEWQEVAEEAGMATAPEADAWEDVFEPEPASDDEAVIDEEALREMVAQMVREELRGQLGERLTQNIRRLVRREIARALSLQEFE